MLFREFNQIDGKEKVVVGSDIIINCVLCHVTLKYVKHRIDCDCDQFYV